MIWAVAAEAAAICVLTLLVLALAHAYAGLAAAVRSGERDAPTAFTPVAAAERATESAPETLHGTTPEGEAVVIPLNAVVGEVLLAFLSSACSSCQHLMERLDTAADTLGSDLRLVVVAKGPERESPAALRRQAGHQTASSAL